MSEIKLQPAMKAVIEFKGKILILQESKADTNASAGRYHLPGGRVEPGETFQDGLLREVEEETGLKVNLGQPFFVGEWRPVIKGVPHQIVATFFHVIAESNDVRLSQEHDAYKWIEPSEYNRYDIAPPEDDAVKAFISLQTQ